MKKQGKAGNIAMAYYSRKDIQKAIFDFCLKREVIPRYEETFGKRPDTLEYPSDILQQVKKGALSFHCSEELWEDALKLSTDLKPEQLNDLRTGWDLLIDIDSKYLDYSKISAELIIKAIKFSGIRNFGIKFSGSKGFHIIIPWKAFPEQIHEQKTKHMFPEWPRIIVSYIKDLINENLIERISEITIKDRKSYVKDPEEAKKVIPDLVLVSSRHLFRAPYSLHEKGLVSVVIDEKEVAHFNPKDANPLKVTVKNFYPEPEKNEARELLISALDWYKQHKPEEKKYEKKGKFKEIKIDKSKITHPPCVSNILKGLSDGKKRALFILINYFRSLGLDLEEIESRVAKWNEKNKPPLKQVYINSQIQWNKRQKKVMPPNCDKPHYKDIGVCRPDELCNKIKNPVNYTIRKSRFNKRN